MMNGAPGAIRTPDPQIRRLVESVDSQRFSLKTARGKTLSEQPLAIPLQTGFTRDRPPPESENPGARAGAAGAEIADEKQRNRKYHPDPRTATLMLRYGLGETLAGDVALLAWGARP